MPRIGCHLIRSNFRFGTAKTTYMRRFLLGNWEVALLGIKPTIKPNTTGTNNLNKRLSRIS